MKERQILFAFLAVSPLWIKVKNFAFPTPLLSCKFGKYNGYIGFSENKLKLPNLIDNDGLFDVHGGISFDGNFTEEKEIIPITEMPKYWWKYRIIGFDYAHGIEGESSVTFSDVKKETLSLYKQIKNAINEQL